MKTIIAAILLIAVMALAGGCQNPNDPINRATADFKEGVGAIFSKANRDGVINGGQLNGDFGVDSPGYKIEGWAGLFNGIYFQGTVQMLGVDGKMAGGVTLGPRPGGPLDTPAPADPEADPSN